jgi:hypothetical protein
LRLDDLVAPVGPQAPGVALAGRTGLRLSSIVCFNCVGRRFGGGGGGGNGGGGGAGYGGGGGGTGADPGSGGSSYVIASATDTSSSATNTGGGSVTITYDLSADACPTPALTLSGNPEVGSTNTFNVQLVVPSGDPAPSEPVVVSDGTQSCDATLSNPSNDGVTYTGNCRISGEAIGATVSATYDADGGDPSYSVATSDNLTVGGPVVSAGGSVGQRHRGQVVQLLGQRHRVPGPHLHREGDLAQGGDPVRGRAALGYPGHRYRRYLRRHHHGYQRGRVGPAELYVEGGHLSGET